MSVASITLGAFTLTPILDGYFRLDGGAMFGVVPRPLWEKVAAPDDRHRERVVPQAGPRRQQAGQHEQRHHAEDVAGDGIAGGLGQQVGGNAGVGPDGPDAQERHQAQRHRDVHAGPDAQQHEQQR